MKHFWLCTSVPDPVLASYRAPRLQRRWAPATHGPLWPRTGHHAYAAEYQGWQWRAGGLEEEANPWAEMIAAGMAAAEADAAGAEGAQGPQAEGAQGPRAEGAQGPGAEGA